MIKTNVLRMLDKQKIPYILKGENDEKQAIYKTLVTIGSNKTHYVFVVPIDHELNLKLAAKVVNVKNIELIPRNDLLKTTGYIHGGCSPIGMKKTFQTVLDASVLEYKTIHVSAGKVGFSIEIDPNLLKEFVQATIANIIM